MSPPRESGLELGRFNIFTNDQKRNDGVTPAGTFTDSCWLTHQASAVLENCTINDNDNVDNANKGKHGLIV